jgi:hypothetical protein
VDQFPKGQELLFERNIFPKLMKIFQDSNFKDGGDDDDDTEHATFPLCMYEKLGLFNLIITTVILYHVSSHERAKLYLPVFQIEEMLSPCMQSSDVDMRSFVTVILASIVDRFKFLQFHSLFLILSFQ